jgi:hypothetical protein
MNCEPVRPLRRHAFALFSVELGFRFQPQRTYCTHAKTGTKAYASMQVIKKTLYRVPLATGRIRRLSTLAIAQKPQKTKQYDAIRRKNAPSHGCIA